MSLALKGLLVLSSFAVNVGVCPKGDGSRKCFYQEDGEREGIVFLYLVKILLLILIKKNEYVQYQHYWASPQRQRLLY